MVSYPLQHPYLEADTSSGADSEAEIDFEIDSNVSDADLLAIKKELERLKHREVRTRVSRRKKVTSGLEPDPVEEVRHRQSPLPQIPILFRSS